MTGLVLRKYVRAQARMANSASVFDWSSKFLSVFFSCFIWFFHWLGSLAIHW